LIGRIAGIAGLTQFAPSRQGKFFFRALKLCFALTENRKSRKPDTGFVYRVFHHTLRFGSCFNEKNAD
jgi:hypothetical protein